MDESAGFLSSPPIMALKGDAHITISKVIRHNYRINLPDNVNESRTKYNYDFVYENEKLIKVDNQIAAQKVQAKKLELFSLVENDWNQQQESYSPSKRTSFKKYCETHNGFLDIVLPGARQSWFEAQGICKFTDNYIEDAITGQRKMGELIVESINWEKLENLVLEIQKLIQISESNVVNKKRLFY